MGELSRAGRTDSTGAADGSAAADIEDSPILVGFRPVRDGSSRASGTARIWRIGTWLATVASSGPALTAKAATRELVVADHANANQELVQAAHTQLATARIRTGN